MLDGDELEKVKVEATVIGHERGKKIHGLKFKPKRGYKRRDGHRSELTRLEISEIKVARSRRSSRRRRRRTPTMAHKKGLGSSRNGRDSNAQRLGVKVFAGETRDRRRDHRAPARHPLQAGRGRRHRQGRHDLRRAPGHRGVRDRPARPRDLGRAPGRVARRL